MLQWAVQERIEADSQIGKQRLGSSARRFQLMGEPMKNGEFPVINRKRSWTKRQWVLYRRLPWVGRRLADVMVLTPRLSRWVCGQVMRQQRRFEHWPDVIRNTPATLRRMARAFGVFLLFVPSPASAHGDGLPWQMHIWADDNCGADGWEMTPPVCAAPSSTRSPFTSAMRP